jgi:colanic acid/amylovoran biosynthesis glycosyltransferase
MVVSFHGYDFSTWPRKMGRSVYKDLFNTVDSVTANSSHTAQKLRALGCPEGKLHILPMGVDLREFPLRERARRADEGRRTKDEGVGAGERVRMLTVGRLVAKKGVEYSIRAVAQLRDKHPCITYDIVGDGPLRVELESLVDQLKLRDTVVFHGAKDSNYVRRLMSQAHIFVLSSVTASDGDQEGQGLVLQEAQASGLTVLATEHNGFAESIVPNKSGFLVPERDVEALAERLDFLLAHPDLWPEMGRTGRKLVEDRYDSSKLSLQLASLYEQVIEQFRL